MHACMRRVRGGGVTVSRDTRTFWSGVISTLVLGLKQTSHGLADVSATLRWCQVLGNAIRGLDGEFDREGEREVVCGLWFLSPR